jgi:hypothetical protein
VPEHDVAGMIKMFIQLQAKLGLTQRPRLRVFARLDRLALQVPPVELAVPNLLLDNRAVAEDQIYFLRPTA